MSLIKSTPALTAIPFRQRTGLGEREKLGPGLRDGMQVPLFFLQATFRNRIDLKIGSKRENGMNGDPSDVES